MTQIWGIVMILSLFFTFRGHGIGALIVSYSGGQEPHGVSETSQSTDRLEEPSTLVQRRL